MTSLPRNACAALIACGAETAASGDSMPGSHMNHIVPEQSAKCGRFTCSLSSWPSSGPKEGRVVWSETASRELEAELHRLHEIWNEGNTRDLRKYIIGDEVLPTFELDPRSQSPNYVADTRGSRSLRGGRYPKSGGPQPHDQARQPTVRCRAMETWGICTEECTVYYNQAETGQRLATDNLRATQVAIKTADGWRWIQWHMSDSSPPESVALH
jgi:hypothetical protein